MAVNISHSVFRRYRMLFHSFAVPTGKSKRSTYTFQACAAFPLSPLSLSVSLSLCLSVSLSLCLSVSLSLCFSVSLSVYVCLSLCLSLYISLSLCLCLVMSLSLSLCLCLSVSLCLCVSLSLCLCLSVSFLFGHIKKISSYIAQYPILRIAQSAYTLLPWQTCSIRHHLNFSGKHPATCCN